MVQSRSMKDNLKNSLVSEVGLTPQQADVYLLVNMEGRMGSDEMAARLEVDVQSVRQTADSLVDLGGFIMYDDVHYEAMHPRFTAVNMYRRTCERRGVKFGRNNIVDSIGVTLEQPYDDARTKDRRN